LCLCGFVFAATPGVWLDVPFIKQEKELRRCQHRHVMQYWRKRQAKEGDAAADAVAIQRILYSKKITALALPMWSITSSKTVSDFAFAGKWDDLKQHLERGVR